MQGWIEGRQVLPCQIWKILCKVVWGSAERNLKCHSNRGGTSIPQFMSCQAVSKITNIFTRFLTVEKTCCILKWYDLLSIWSGPWFFILSQKWMPDSYHNPLRDFGVQEHFTDLIDSVIPHRTTRKFAVAWGRLPLPLSAFLSSQCSLCMVGSSWFSLSILTYPLVSFIFTAHLGCLVGKNSWVWLLMLLGRDSHP